MELEKAFICPHCKNPLSPRGFTGICSRCKFTYEKKDGIWHFLYIPDKKSEFSKNVYDEMHKIPSERIDDGSYEILAAFARGNKTLDIACGDGFIEKLAPETIGVEFSLEGLKKARKKGAKHLVQADAHSLPFKDKAFELAVCAGSLEHFANPLKALKEMARVSTIQILTVHKKLPIPFSNFLRSFILNLKSVKDQPIDFPISMKELEKILTKAKMHIVFKGVWTHPYDFQMLGFKIPKLLQIPSCHFVITTSP
ncbi:hypothetical protein A3D00_05730 [Candidatus Woesebacteria bacterium RIFCSPHIGHO2_02_FULL_38_9]|uniref:Methyltransferase type 11 domain-containing protein n=1 Tax=Candidatus Woesebacteria bacterium RIFCSPHIGHO2_01_FULL_39_28 TaxID=1802496 RepID=A0A1F7YI11_9BACT|nr:MAG: hypothetical protein A2627_02395 [Candidatus Woesebacteria bacterium RIFCSPHIGHO2_01_FULL_39_28]OGM34431.1 MAG: hypothetical protein A3D00_05730 [Candidatus Woesebacteria bacterium RIFCSPHIGHO2_02_FULL_38_9]OGM57177.1 MAG: hypothetical protein A3A50_03255 [Candidatus Woesebacteria bacterium RIFCSPLOWO2_01_FULL_38_20]